MYKERIWTQTITLHSLDILIIIHNNNGSLVSREDKSITSEIGKIMNILNDGKQKAKE